MAVSDRTLDILRHLATKPGHDEVKADFRQLLIEEFGVGVGALEFERRVPEVKGRLDALIGRTVFEAKSNLKAEWADVERRMPDYLADRERDEKERFVGIASDGLNWAVFELDGSEFVKVKETTLVPDDAERFLAWLDGVLALKASLPPDPLTIRMELGQDSIAYRRARSAMVSAWGRLEKNKAALLKRQLWAQLLKLVYGRDVETQDLFVQHTYLVIVAKAIAVAVLNLREDDPLALLSGAAFRDAGILGAVESDFFDWIVADPEGEALARRIMAHVRRFRLDEVQTDVLKILYESLIDASERHGLGEYYTPDWLAAKVVRAAVDRPLEQTVLDPACGSGTFLFHAVRGFLIEAEEGDMPVADRAREATRLVVGTDIHPVAVIIARVTYLLALAPVLANRAGILSIPVYLGDAMQLSVAQTFTMKELRIPVPAAPDGLAGPASLDFPEAYCREPILFDKAIEALRIGAEQNASRAQVEHAIRRETEMHFKRDVTREEEAGITDFGKTYLDFVALRNAGRDTVWAYVARNLSRPLAFSSGIGWANVLVGNPPWVAYRHMSPELQKRFKELAKGDRVYVGGKLATQNDLCALFVVRAISLYLRSGGRFAFVLPHSVLTRGQFAPLREGSFASARLQYDEIWTMDDRLQPLFPVPSCAVFGRRRAVAVAMPDAVKQFTGSLPMRDAPEVIADARLKVADGIARPTEAKLEGGSPYRERFRQGATLVPRFMCLVDRKPAGRLGINMAAPAVMSRRTNQEKKPWSKKAPLDGPIEIEFLRPVIAGESILPYRLFCVFEGIIPALPDGECLDSQGALNRGYQSLARWMLTAENVWNSEKSTLSLIQRWNFQRAISVQFPIRKLRVVYTKSGTQPAAIILRDSTAVVDHKLYWHALETEAEAAYLVALLNSEAARSRVEQYQSRGLFGARDFDKVIFNLPIPLFDARDPLHVELADAAAVAEAVAVAVPLDEGMPFQRARKRVRDALSENGIAAKIDALVVRLLDE